MALASLAALALPAAANAVDCVTSRHQPINFTTCTIDLTRESLRLYLRDGAGAPLHSFSQLRENLARDHEELVFAMNAGMFHPDYRPVGLLVIDGIQYSPLNKARALGNFYLQPNGVFWIGPDGAWVAATGDFHQVEAQPLLATQSGPMLVYKGEIPPIPEFNSRSRHIRNGVCTPTREKIVFAISEKPVTLREIAEYFRTDVGCTEALYLDGSISSLYSRSLSRADKHARLGPIFAVAESAAGDQAATR
jgi:uncharacterized protein YigE (DUF2233 family)